MKLFYWLVVTPLLILNQTQPCCCFKTNSTDRAQKKIDKLTKLYDLVSEHNKPADIAMNKNSYVELNRYIATADRNTVEWDLEITPADTLHVNVGSRRLNSTPQEESDTYFYSWSMLSLTPGTAHLRLLRKNNGTVVETQTIKVTVTNQ